MAKSDVEYREHSSDAMFSRIIERLERQDASLGRIEVEIKSGGADTKRRLQALERTRWRHRGFVAGFGSLGVAAGEVIRRIFHE